MFKLSTKRGEIMATLVKILRIMNGETQKEIADALKCDLSTFNLKENGKREFSLKEAQILSDRYNISLDKLVRYAEKTKEEIISILQQ